MDTDKFVYIVKKAFPVQTQDGEKELVVGAVLSLPLEKALPLLKSKLIEPQGGESLDFNAGFLSGRYIVTIKTSSGRLISLAGHTNALANATIGRAMFFVDELKALSGKPREMMERVIDAKELFPGCQIEAEIDGL
jgi:hypothetical protein